MATQQPLVNRFGAFITTWAGFLTSIGVIITAVIATWNVVIRPKDLAVYINKQDVNFPAAINDRFGRVYNYIIDSSRNLSLDSDVYATYVYLQNTNNFWVITLHNQTDNSVKGIAVKVTGVTALGSSAVRGDYLNDSESTALSREVHFDSASKIVYLTKIDALHPRANLKLYLWGKMDNLALWSNVSVTYEGGDARAGEEYTTTGFKALLCEYLYEILVLFAAVCTYLYWRTTKRVSIPGGPPGLSSPVNPASANSPTNPSNPTNPNNPGNASP
jgi:hypothetical protein